MKDWYWIVFVGTGMALLFVWAAWVTFVGTFVSWKDMKKWLKGKWLQIYYSFDLTLIRIVWLIYLLGVAMINLIKRIGKVIGRVIVQHTFLFYYIITKGRKL
jgi:hypothetical protein